MCYDEVGLCPQNISTILGLIVNKVFHFDPKAFASQLHFWNVEWQFALFAIVNWSRPFLIQSNSQNACSRAAHHVSVQSGIEGTCTVLKIEPTEWPLWSSFQTQFTWQNMWKVYIRIGENLTYIPPNLHSDHKAWIPQISSPLDI